MSTATQITPFNMHMHSHFSFNAEFMSPTQLVERAVREGLFAGAVCDFDVMDGIDEFYGAADLAGLRSSVAMETRVFFSEYGDKVINSPGEPGVFYFMGMGFGRVPAQGTPAAKTLSVLRQRSAERNRAMIDRINPHFPQMALDYDRDVLPLAPSGNATERHIVLAYVDKIKDTAAGDEAKESALWQEILGVDEAAAAGLIADKVKLQNTLRSKVMKSGGVGYVQPDRTTFPQIEYVIEMILNAGGIPMATWLDGTSDGEADPVAQLECLMAKGVAAVNIIPDRNWNISDPEVKAIKVQKMAEYVKAARDLKLPINVGTELNSFGLPFVDNFEVEPMLPHWEAFLEGALVMIGQSRFARYADFSYCGEAAKSEFGDDVDAKIALFRKLGELDVPGAATRQKLEEIGTDRCYSILVDSANKATWTI